MSISTSDAMNNPVALVISSVFVALALWHFTMAFLPWFGMSGAVPSVQGKPLFVPSRAATVAVGIVLLLFAVLVAATARMVDAGVPEDVLSWLCYALAAGLLARAVGDFKYVGFFKPVRDSRFATLDTFVFSPLCLLLALGVAVVARHNGA